MTTNEEARSSADPHALEYFGTPTEQAGVPFLMDTSQLHKRFLETTGACSDTRALLPDGMYFALKGPSFDANLFAAKALAGGCRYAVVDDPTVAVDDRFIVVPHVLTAMQQLATYHRRRSSIPVIGITGSNGKTTTKELMHAVLGADRPTLATSGNLNNHIGVPLTLLRLRQEHRIAIIEMGANHVGEIAALTAIAEPTHGLITNIGKAHLEGFGDYDGVIRAKTEMYAWIRAHDGILFVNGDDPLLMGKSDGIRREHYGTSGDLDTSGSALEQGPFLTVAFHGRDQEEHTAHTRLVGDYNLPNALAAICVGQHFGVADNVIVKALEEYSPSNNRSQFIDTGRNHLVLDAYNANPSSMALALRNFAAMPGDRPKVAILGGMKELGEASPMEHALVVDLVRELGLDAVYVGPEFGAIGDDDIKCYPDATALLAALEHAPLSGKLVLVKGSRGTKLELVVPGL